MCSKCPSKGAIIAKLLSMLVSAVVAVILLGILKRYILSVYDKIRYYKGYLDNMGISVGCEAMDKMDEARVTRRRNRGPPAVPTD